MNLITFVSVFLFVNYARSGLVLKDDEYVKPVTRNAYKYNHPPLAEYSSVPVVVFYDAGKSKDNILPKVRTSKVSVDNTSPQKEVSKSNGTSGVSEPDITTKPPEPKIRIDGTKPDVTTLKPSDDLSHTKDVLTEKPTDSTATSITTSEVDPNKQTVDILSTTSTESALNTIPANKEKKKIQIPRDGLIIPVAVVYDIEPENFRKPHVTKRKPLNRQQRDKESEKESENFDKSGDKNDAKNNNFDKTLKVSTTFPKRTEGRDPIIPIVQSENYVFSHSGDFHYSYEGGDGTKAFERGEHKANIGGEAVEGSFSYIGKDGKDYSLTYTADENGYHPVGDHLPTPPPIPPAIARALKYLATKPTTESFTESY